MDSFIKQLAYVLARIRPEEENPGLDSCTKDSKPEIFYQGPVASLHLSFHCIYIPILLKHVYQKDVEGRTRDPVDPFPVSAHTKTSRFVQEMWYPVTAYIQRITAPKEENPILALSSKQIPKFLHSEILVSIHFQEPRLSMECEIADRIALVPPLWPFF